MNKIKLLDVYLSRILDPRKLSIEGNLTLFSTVILIVCTALDLMPTLVTVLVGDALLLYLFIDIIMFVFSRKTNLLRAIYVYYTPLDNTEHYKDVYGQYMSYEQFYKARHTIIVRQ